MKSEKLKSEAAPEGGLTAKKRRAIPAIIESKSMEVAAKRADCDRSTLYRWLAEPDFQAELREVQDRAFSEALMRLQGTARAAVEVLIESLSAKSPTEKRLAAVQILEMTFKSLEIGEFSERLKDLEDRLSVRA